VVVWCWHINLAFFLIHRTSSTDPIENRKKARIFKTEREREQAQYSEWRWGETIRVYTSEYRRLNQNIYIYIYIYILPRKKSPSSRRILSTYILSWELTAIHSLAYKPVDLLFLPLDHCARSLLLSTY
jgi:hypothetical protein